ncbi:MAG: hypothetical protein AAFP77_24630 [Bacteroidota bacterium]
MIRKQYRYPGAQPFQTIEKEIFFGREQDVEQLYQLIQLEPLVVLFAKSGLGKSSLINAGLIPRVEADQNLDCFNIRFGAYEKEASRVSPVAAIKEALQAAPSFLRLIADQQENSLWYQLKSKQLNHSNRGMLLIFDQFEELFTYPDDMVEEFAQQLSEALYTNIPQRIRNQRRNNEFDLSTEQLQALDEPIDLRILMAIRSDRMSLLKRLKAYLPTILTSDYELTPLNTEQAEEAILSPAYLKSSFATSIFDYEDAAIEHLLDYLSNNRQEPIESFQLQILCEFVEQALVEEQNKKLIQAEDLSRLDEILENYYFNKIKLLNNEEERLAARKLIEEGLVFEEEERRLTLYEGQIFKNYDVSSELLRKLLNSHLIRSEPSLRGGYTYELSHDTLVAPVLKAKKKRLEEERRKREAQERQAREQALHRAEARAQEERQLRERAEVNAKKAKIRTRLALWIAGLAIISTVLAFVQFDKASTERLKAENSLRQLKEKQVENDKLRIKELLGEVDIYLRAEELLSAQNRLEKALQIAPDNPEVLKKLRQLEDRD